MPYMELLPYICGGASHMYRNPILQLVNGVSIQSSPKSFILLLLRQIITWRRPSRRVRKSAPALLPRRGSRPNAYRAYIKDTGYSLGKPQYLLPMYLTTLN